MHQNTVTCLTPRDLCFIVFQKLYSLISYFGIPYFVIFILCVITPGFLSDNLSSMWQNQCVKICEKKRISPLFYHVMLLSNLCLTLVCVCCNKRTSLQVYVIFLIQRSTFVGSAWSFSVMRLFMNESFVTITHFLDESLSNLYSILLDPKEKVKYHQKVLNVHYLSNLIFLQTQQLHSYQLR